MFALSLLSFVTLTETLERNHFIWLPTHTDLTFKDVIGIDEFKEELEDIVFYMKNRETFTKKGLSIPKGVLLIGPPGCGKTQIARAVAGESKVPFYHVNSSDLLSPIVGHSERKIRSLFNRAKMTGGIIFIDEIDSFPNRNKVSGYANAILNQILTEMDGFETKNNVMVIGATNLEQNLDPALTRSGRFDLKIHIMLPFKENRKKIL